MNKYMIGSKGESLTAYPPKCVLAESPEDALKIYLKVVYSKNVIFREQVLDLAINMSFSERFYLATKLERFRFEKDCDVGTEIEIIRSRVKAYFALCPDIGEKYLRYMDTQDQSYVTEDVFEFIAANSGPEEHGLVALPLDAIETIN